MTEICHRMKRRRDNQSLFGRLLACLTVAAMLSAGGATAKKTEFTGPAPTTSGKLVGWLLVAAPRMRDPRFAKTVIFLAHHDDSGAMGLIVNRPIAVGPASKLLERMVGKDRSVDDGREVRIHYGGPVQPSQGIFIHSNDYSGKGTVKVTEQVSLTLLNRFDREFSYFGLFCGIERAVFCCSDGSFLSEPAAVPTCPID